MNKIIKKFKTIFIVIKSTFGTGFGLRSRIIRLTAQTIAAPIKFPRIIENPPFLFDEN
jgi:hypothetical protein